MGIMKNDETFFFYKGKVYRKIDEIQSKNGLTREWTVKVLYQSVEGHLYTRDIEEFYERFSAIDSFCIDATKFKLIQNLKPDLCHTKKK